MGGSNCKKISQKYLDHFLLIGEEDTDMKVVLTKSIKT